MASIGVDAVADRDVRTAIAASHLRDLPPDVIAKLTAEARRVRIPAGTTIHFEGETESYLELVVRGLVRIRVSAPDGRTMTVRYCRRGALIGAPTLFAVGVVRRFAVQALSDSELLRLRAAIVRGLADRDVRVARALLDETSERVLSFVAELSGNAFATVRQRLARHLLDLASERQRGPELIAPLTQQELADAIGTVREVVVRVLRELREEGVVRTGRYGVVINDPERLFRAADARVEQTFLTRDRTHLMIPAPDQTIAPPRRNGDERRPCPTAGLQRGAALRRCCAHRARVLFPW